MTLYHPLAFPLGARERMSGKTFTVFDSERSTASLNHERSSIPRSCNPDTEEDCPNEVLMCAVERGLSTLGESVAQVVFYNLDRRYSLKRQDILRKPNRFVEALQAIFGSGAETIQKLIIRSICSTTGLDSKSLRQLSLPSCIKEAQKALRAKQKTGK